MEIFAFWFLFAIVVGIIAGSRGRNGFGWFLLALFLTPILMGILVLALPSLNAATSGSVAGDNRQRLACPTCAELVLAEANKCKHCGADLAAFRSVRDAAEQREIDRYREMDRQLREERQQVVEKFGRAVGGIFGRKGSKRDGPQDHV